MQEHDADTPEFQPADWPFVSVILPIYNDYEQLQRTLELLDAQTYPHDRFEVIVVDNGSDNPPDEVHCGTLAITLLREPTPSSYKARNRGIAVARGNILAFIDSDCFPRADWLQQGVWRLNAPDRPDYVGGRVDVIVQDPDHPTPTELYEKVTAFRMERYMERRHYGGAGNLFVRREVFDKVGTFDETLQSGGDAEFGQRVWKAGIRQAYGRDVVVCHPARRTFKKRAEKALRIHAAALVLAEQGDAYAKTVLAGRTRFLRPPTGALLQIAASEEIHGIADKFKASMVLLGLHYTFSIERFRTGVLKMKPRGWRPREEASGDDSTTDPELSGPRG